MSTELKEHLKSAGTWKRGLFILLFAVFYGVAEVVLGAIVLFQFGSQLITGRPNDKLKAFSRGLTAYFYQLLQFLTYRSDLKPFPFSDWPDEGLESVQEQEREMQQAAQREDDVEKQPAEPAKPARSARSTRKPKTAKPAEPPKPGEADESEPETKE
jgi:hypothetical protein